MVPNRGPQLQAVCGTMVTLAFVSTALRCYVRLRLVKCFGIDDYFMIFALLAQIMFATCSITGVHYGTGRHFADLTPENIFMAMRYWWLCYIAYCLSMIGAKLSIGYFLLRVTVIRIHRQIIYSVVFLTVLVGSVFSLITIFQCTPVSYFWGRILGESGHCVNVNVIMGLTYFYGTVSAICDLTFGILPIFLVWNLNMNKRMKIALIPIMGMGCIASTAVIVRMAYIKDFKSDDFLWATVDIAIWSDVEQGLAITAGSLATLRPLLRDVATRMGWSASTKASQPYHKSPSNTFGQKIGKPRRSQFSMMSFTRDDARGQHDDESALHDFPTPIQQGGNLSEERNKNRGTVQEREYDSKEELGANNWFVSGYPVQAHTEGKASSDLERYLPK